MLFQQLLIDLFKFLAPFLRNAELAKQTHLLYKVRSQQIVILILLIFCLLLSSGKRYMDFLFLFLFLFCFVCLFVCFFLWGGGGVAG